jgi:pimeloyl-ACP methyl ester carboxylesterase
MDVGATFQFLVDALSRLTPAFAERTFIAPDWRGFGLSQNHPCADHYSYVDYLGDLDFMLRQWSPNAAVDLIAHSMGGNIAMHYAGLRPHRIRSLVNLEGFGLPQTQAQEAPARLVRWLDELESLYEGGLKLRHYSSLEQVAQRLQKTNPRLPLDKALWLAQHWAQPAPQADGEAVWRILADPAHKLVNPQLYRVEEVQAIHAQISAPVLSVFAQDSEMDSYWQGRYSRSEYLERMQSVANMEHIEVADCGHMLHHDQADALAASICAFYRKHHS